MPFHFCGGLDDLIYIPLYLIMLLPFFKGIRAKVYTWYLIHFKHKKECCSKDCKHSEDNVITLESKPRSAVDVMFDPPKLPTDPKK
jgi:hypothetical protein